jgi:solute:Na+ symporter, SSS family
MMDITLFWSLFVVLGITYFAIAMSASRNIVSDDEFFYGDRKFGVFPISLSLAAAHIGGGFFLGSAQEAYFFGLYGVFYNLGICAGFFILALGLANKLRRENIRTTAELFFTKYGSNFLRRIASLLSIITLGGILTGQIIASRKLLDSLVGQYHWVLIIFWLLVIIYTMIGGLKAIIATEIFQLFVIVLVFLCVCLMYFSANDLAFTISWNMFELFTVDSLFEAPSYHRYMSLFLTPFFYAFFAQDLGQRFFSTRTPKIASFSAFFAGIIILLFAFLPVLIGMQARFLGLEPHLKGSVIFSLFEKSTSPFFYYLLVCAVIAAISSTADAVLCAIGSNVVQDFFLASEKLEMEKIVGVLLSRIIVLFIGITALFLAYHIDDILTVLLFSYEISISCVLVPIIFALILSNPRYPAALLAMTMGLVGFIVFRFYHPIPKELLSIMFSLLGYFIGHFYDYIKEKKTAKNSISCPKK